MTGGIKFRTTIRMQFGEEHPDVEVCVEDIATEVEGAPPRNSVAMHCQAILQRHQRHRIKHMVFLAMETHLVQ